LFANQGFGGDVVFIHSHNQIVHNQPCLVAVHVALSGYGPRVILLAVATVEVLADVMSDIVANDESTSGMLVHELTDVENQIVE